MEKVKVWELIAECSDGTKHVHIEIYNGEKRHDMISGLVYMHPGAIRYEVHLRTFPVVADDDE